MNRSPQSFRPQSQGEESTSDMKSSAGIVEDTRDPREQKAAYKKLESSCRSTPNNDPMECVKSRIPRLQERLGIMKEIGDKTGEGGLHRKLGIGYYAIGEYEKATDHWKLTLEVAKDIGHRRHEGAAYQNLGACYRSLGQYDEAISHLQQGLEIVKEIGEKGDERAAYQNLAACYHFFGQYDKAISYLQRGLEIAEEIGDKSGEGEACRYLGASYHSVGQCSKATSHLKRGLEIAKDIGNKSGEGSAYRDLGLCYQSLSLHNTAISHLKQGLKIAREIGDKSGEGLAYQDLGACFQSLGQYDKAISLLRQGLDIAKAIGDKRSEGKAYQKLGAFYHSLGQHKKAISYLHEGLRIARDIGDKTRKAIACRNLGALYKSVQVYGIAERMLRNSVTCFKELFNDAPNSDADKVSLMDISMDSFQNLIDSLVCQGKTDEALLVAEDGRAMSLKYLMNTANLVTDLSHPDELNLEKIREMGKSLSGCGVIFFVLLHSQICTWIIQKDGEIGLLKTQLTEQVETLKILKLLVDKVFKVVTRDGEVRCDVSLTGQSIKMVAEIILEEGTEFIVGVLVYTLLGLMTPTNESVSCDDRSLSFLYPEASNPTEMSCKPVPPPLQTFSSHNPPRSARAQQSRVVPDAHYLQENMATNQPNQNAGFKIPQDEELMHSLLAHLYKLLLDPVRQHIAGSQVVIVPEGPLALVPFAALVDENGRYVAESGARIRLVPSLGAARFISKRPRNPIRRALIIGDPHVGKITKDGKIIAVPRIPSAVREAKLIGKVLRCKPLIGGAATKEKYLQNVESADLIHIAAHGDAERGEILLAAPAGTGDDQLVPVEDVMLKTTDLEGKRIQAQLVVLSSCYSGRGKVQGEGVVGMARAFLGAGARAVLVTLWAVDDVVTYPMIGIFYNGLWQGKCASEALSDAMKAVRESQEVFRHPRFWAPFILLGDDVSPLGEQGCNIHTACS